jgi:hypothetical protein
MASLFDLVTVACFLVVVGAFVFLTERDTKTLTRMMVAAIAFAVANQIGNRGAGVLAILLIGAGLGYAVLVVVRK